MNALLIFVGIVIAWFALILFLRETGLVRWVQEEEEDPYGMLSLDAVDPNKGKRRRQVVKQYVRMI